MKAPEDAPTIGLLLCKSKKRVVAEYALKTTSSPIGVAEYQLVEALPKTWKQTYRALSRSSGSWGRRAHEPSSRMQKYRVSAAGHALIAECWLPRLLRRIHVSFHDDGEPEPDEDPS